MIIALINNNNNNKNYIVFWFCVLSSGNQIAALSQMSWLMKTAAIELRVTSLNRQRSHTQRLVSLLLDDQPHPQHTGLNNYRSGFSKCIKHNALLVMVNAILHFSCSFLH